MTAADAVVIRPCTPADVDAMVALINAAATAYAGVIPADCYGQPYMPREELCEEIAAGVRFWGLFEGAGEAAPGLSPAGPALAGVMGIQDVDDVTLIRHAYVLPAWQRRGVGGRLLAHLMDLAERRRLDEQVPEGPRQAERPLLVGTWAAAWWAVAFYERHGFALVTPAEKDRLLRRYWTISERQVETSVVLRHRARG